MRDVYTCLACGVTYLPPEAMEYPETGTTASVLHCATEACREAVESGRVTGGVPVEVLEALAVRAAELRAEPVVSVPPRRPGRGRRPASQRGARSKLA